MTAYLATWLATQDVSTLGHKVVRSHINDKFGVSVDKEAFRAALTSLLAASAPSTAVDSAAAPEPASDAPRTKRARKAAPSKVGNTRKAGKGKKKAGDGDGGAAGPTASDATNEVDELLADTIASGKKSAGSSTIDNVVGTTTGDADALINDIFGNEDAATPRRRRPPPPPPPP
jgi:hypothetical protein